MASNGNAVAPDEPATEFERVIETLGLQLFFEPLVQAGVMDLERLREMEWEELKDVGLPVPLRSRVVDWQNDEVFVPRWSTGTCACTSDKPTCAVTTCCPCYAFNRIWQEGEVKPSPCPLFGCFTYIFCFSFFPCIGCFARQHLSVKYGFTPIYPQKDEETGRDSRKDALEDFCCHLCCHPCTLCQEMREMKHHAAGRQGRTFINRSAESGVPPPPPPEGGPEPAPEQAGDAAADLISAAIGSGVVADDAKDGVRPPPAGGGHRAAMGAPAAEMER